MREILGDSYTNDLITKHHDTCLRWIFSGPTSEGINLPVAAA